MTDAEMVTMVTTLVAEPRFDQFVASYLELAKGAVMQHLFPYRDVEWADVPEKYHARTCEIAVYLVNRRGGEGETTHSESGVSRSYESAGIPASYFRGMVPFVGVPS
ncbi:MAG: hypothetical protein IJ781_02155 [Atopobiaceae bacterium]|nr:hypothetical protein [Atopobiaceae bacterium]